MEEKLFSIKDGRIVELDWADDEMNVWTTGASRRRIGQFLFRHIEGPSENGRDDHYHLTHMHLEGPDDEEKGTYVRQGIGREIIRRVREIYPITLSPYDGIVREDGSHLTEDGPAFASKMAAERLITWGNDDLDDDY